jgi:ankyrin repeat protein
VLQGAKITAPDSDGWNSLHYAASYGSTIILKNVLLNDNDAKDAVTHDGNTPLHLAAQQNSEEILKLLAEADVDYEAKNAQNQTPAAMALFYQNPSAADFIIKKGKELPYLRMKEMSNTIKLLEQQIRHLARIVQQNLPELPDAPTNIMEQQIHHLTTVVQQNIPEAADALLVNDKELQQELEAPKPSTEKPIKKLMS